MGQNRAIQRALCSQTARMADTLRALDNNQYNPSISVALGLHRFGGGS